MKNFNTLEIVYNSPQEDKEIRDLPKNLEDYINDNEKMALIHYQFFIMEMVE